MKHVLFFTNLPKDPRPSYTITTEDGYFTWVQSEDIRRYEIFSDICMGKIVSSTDRYFGLYSKAFEEELEYAILLKCQ